MFLVRLIYASSIGDGFQGGDLNKILSSAQDSNAKMNVTGALCYNRKYFLQALEGSRESVNHIYEKIIKDTRHTKIILLQYETIDTRAFSEWSMAYVPETKLSSAVLLKYSEAKDFNPYKMSGEGALQMMLSLQEAFVESAIPS